MQIVNYFHMKLKLFDNFYGSSSTINLVGKQKVMLIHEKYPNYSYDYLGNSSSDVPIWNDCNICYSVKAKKFSGLKKTLKNNLVFYEIRLTSFLDNKSVTFIIVPCGLVSVHEGRMLASNIYKLFRDLNFPFSSTSFPPAGRELMQ